MTNAEFLRTYMSCVFPGDALVRCLEAEVASVASWEYTKILPPPIAFFHRRGCVVTSVRRLVWFPWQPPLRVSLKTLRVPHVVERASFASSSSKSGSIAMD